MGSAILPVRERAKGKKAAVVLPKLDDADRECVPANRMGRLSLDAFRMLYWVNRAENSVLADVVDELILDRLAARYETNREVIEQVKKRELELKRKRDV